MTKYRITTPTAQNYLTTSRMNIYLLNRSEACGYDEYDAKVIVATSKDEARKLANMKVGNEGRIWEDPSQVHCNIIDSESIGVVLESFNAG